MKDLAGSVNTRYPCARRLRRRFIYIGPFSTVSTRAHGHALLRLRLLITGQSSFEGLFRLLP